MSTTAKFIRSDDQTHEALQQLAKEHKLSNTKLLAAMVEYFRVTKADPQQPTAPDLTSSLAKLTAKVADLDKRTIGFIREQEKQYLKPMLAQVQALQQVSSTAAPAQPSQGELRPAQVQELYGWYARMLRRLIVPSQLAPKFQAETLPPPPAKGQEDPALATLKNGLFGILRLALQPDLLTPAATQAPAAPVVPPPTSPA